MLKYFSHIEMNDRLDNIASGLQKAVDQYTEVKAESDLQNNYIIRAVAGGIVGYNYNEQKEALEFSMARNHNTNVVYYEFSELPQSTIVMVNYDYIGQDVVVYIALVNNGNNSKKTIKNGFINLPNWSKLAVIIKQLEVKK